MSLKLGLPLLALLLSACGFQLMGNTPLPPALNRVYLEVATPYRVTEPPVETALRARLARAGGVVVPRPTQAATQVRLWDLRETRETLAIGPDGKALEYRLSFTVRYQVLNGMTPLVQANEISVSRDFSFKADQILAKEAEEAQLAAYMQDEMAELLLLRLRAELPAE